MRTRILHLADLHLGDGHEYLGPLAASRRTEADDLLRRITEHVLRPDSPVGGVLIAGDLFDSHNPPAPLVESVLRDLRRLVDAGVQVLTVPGNHDEYSYPNCVYRRCGAHWPGVLVTQPAPARVATWTLNGVEVDLYSMAFVAGRSAPPYDRFPIDQRPARKIAVLHASLDVDWSDRSVPLRASALAGCGLDYLALGHIHRPSDRRVGEAWACYPGRIEGGCFEDPGGAGLVELDPAAKVIVPMRVEFPSRRIEETTLNVSGFASEEQMEERIEALADPKLILRLRLEGVAGFTLDPGRIENRWGARFHHLAVAARTTGMNAAALQDLLAERTIRGTFARIAAREMASASGDASRIAMLQTALRFGLSAFSPGEPEPGQEEPRAPGPRGNPA